ncbi:hypothetical protein XENTR_v10001667 [Xenopus tropicalis]|nr:hypothetical protein XENTR_v10001667 [Xenopus tropicalis]
MYGWKCRPLGTKTYSMEQKYWEGENIQKHGGLRLLFFSLHCILPYTLSTTPYILSHSTWTKQKISHWIFALKTHAKLCLPWYYLFVCKISYNKLAAGPYWQSVDSGKCQRGCCKTP